MSSYEPHTEVVSWHHTAGMPPVGIPVVMNELARTHQGVTALFISGFGEGYESAANVVQMCEDEFALAAAASWLSHGDVPAEKVCLFGLAEDAPLEIARFVGQGQEVDLGNHSLGSLTVNAAAKEPGMFRAIASDSPHALSARYWGRLPLLGSIEALRPLAAAGRLIVETGWQLRGHKSNEALHKVVDRAADNFKKLGSHALSSTRLALSDEVVDMTGASYVVLHDGGHPMFILVGGRDRVVRPDEVRGSLRRAARRANRPDDLFDGVIHEDPHAMHSPWCLPEGLAKIIPMVEWLKSLPESKRKQPKIAA